MTTINLVQRKIRPAGRPTKHCPRLIGDALEYITNYDNNYYLPTISEMCRKIHISRTQFYEWLKRDDRDTNLIMAALEVKKNELGPGLKQRRIDS